MLEAKLKHLDMIQAVINRMYSNSLIFKGWTITLIAGLSAISSNDSNEKLLLIAFLATLLFWDVDAYYLSFERKYRNLYTKFFGKDVKEIDFNMVLFDDLKMIVGGQRLGTGNTAE